jgi:hypothetical protein
MTGEGAGVRERRGEKDKERRNVEWGKPSDMK